MPFLLETWRAKVSERLWEWRLRFEQARPAAVYTTLSAAALWPLVQAAQSDGLLPVALALGHVVAGVGSNLIAEQIQRWRDQAQPPSEADVDAWITAHIATNTDLRQALDTILEHWQVISQAQEHLQADGRQWFVQTLRTELTAMDNLTRFEAQLTGSGAIARDRAPSLLVRVISPLVAVYMGMSAWGVVGRGNCEVTVALSYATLSRHLWRADLVKSLGIALILHQKGIDSSLWLSTMLGKL